MRYSTVPAINLEAHAARNRELIQALPTQIKDQMVWNPAQLRFVPQLITVVDKHAVHLDRFFGRTR